MHNLFIVNTPLQLLTAYIIANTVEKGQHNQLLLIHPNGYDSWHKSDCLTHMSTDSTTWSQISIVKKWINRHVKYSLFKSQIYRMREELLCNGKIDKVYLCSDKIIQNQLLVELSGNTTYIRFDEGFGSYFSYDRHQASKVWQYLRIKFFRYLGNIKGEMKYNLGGLGHGKAASADYLYKPHLLERYSPNAISINRQDVLATMEKLTNKMSSYDILENNKCVLFLGSDFVERGEFTVDREIEILRSVLNVVKDKGMSLVYKPHTSEKQDKLNLYKQELPDIQLFHSAEPIEAIYYKQDKIQYVISYGSSGLMYTDIFARRKMTPICVSKIYKFKDIDSDLERVMRKAGVMIPQDIERLLQCIV